MCFDSSPLFASEKEKQDEEKTIQAYIYMCYIDIKQKKNIYDNYLMALNNFSPLLIIYDVFGCRKRHMNNLKTTYHLK